MNKIKDYFHQFSPVRIPPRIMLIRNVDEPKGLYFLEKGSVRQFIVSEQGAEITIHIYHPGSFFPLLWALNHIPNQYDFQTITNSVVYISPKDPAVDFIRLDPQVSFELSQRLLFGINGLSKRIENNLTSSARGRVISIINYLVKHFGKKNSSGILITAHFTHQQIASLVGVTRERVSLELEKLVKEGLISYKNHSLYIPHPEKLDQKLLHI